MISQKYKTTDYHYLPLSFRQKNAIELLVKELTK
jgi:hypothetical protein